MEEKHFILIFIIVSYIAFVYLLSLLGRSREIGQRRLFLLSLFLTPIMGLAFLIGSQERKMNPYYEASYKCERCKYTFSEPYEYCPFCEKDGHKEVLKPVNKLMT